MNHSQTNRGDPAKQWLLAVLIAAIAVIAYLPALQAGWIWDDDSYLLDNPTVVQPEGVLDVWIPGSTPQWYPLVFVSFWIQHALHGFNPFAFHAVNLMLHLSSALMLWRVLKALQLPGALFAAMLFALHPVQVESVAWVTERKNVLSMFFALASTISWVRFLSDRTPLSARIGWLGGSFVLFACAMLSKTTAVAVPVLMALIAWWQPWKLSAAGEPLRSLRQSDESPSHSGWKVALLVTPFFALGMALGAVTAWIEATQVGATGAEFQRSALSRLLGASEAWWFYIGAWCWPMNLMFVYPPFPSAPWLPWLCLSAALIVAASAWIASQRGVRGAWVAFLGYCAAVFPALGFLNLYPLRFAPVADHFGYVASAVLAATSAWCVHEVWIRAAPYVRLRWFALGASGAVAILCAALVSRHAEQFHDAPTLWRTALRENPRAWLASNNLVSMLLTSIDEAQSQDDQQTAAALLLEASQLSELSVKLAGAIDMPVQSNLSEVRRLQGRLPESLAAINAAIALQPTASGPYWQRGRLHELMGHISLAEPDYARALELSPKNLIYLRESVRWFTKADRLPEARAIAVRIVALTPTDAEALANLGSLSFELGDVVAARRDLLRALTLADASLAPMIAVRVIRACVAVPFDQVAVRQAQEIAQRLVEETRGEDPIALLLLAHTEALLGSPIAQERLAASDRLLARASVEVKNACASQRREVQQVLDAMHATAPPMQR